MPFSLEIIVHTRQRLILPNNGCIIYKMISELFPRIPGDLLTVSSIYNTSQDSEIEIRQLAPVRFRIVCFDNKYYEEISDFFIDCQMSRKPIKLFNSDFYVNCINTKSHFTKYQTTGDFNSKNKCVSFRIITPAVFRDNIVFPTVFDIFGDVFFIWNKSFDMTIQQSVFESMINNICLKHINIYPVEKGCLLGFSGIIKYELIKFDDNDISAFNILSNFAYYSGIGKNSKYGCGQCIVHMGE